MKLFDNNCYCEIL